VAIRRVIVNGVMVPMNPAPKKVILPKTKPVETPVKENKTPETPDKEIVKVSCGVKYLDLMSRSVKDLKIICKDEGLSFKGNASRKALIKLIEDRVDGVEADL